MQRTKKRLIKASIAIALSSAFISADIFAQSAATIAARVAATQAAANDSRERSETSGTTNNQNRNNRSSEQTRDSDRSGSSSNNQNSNTSNRSSNANRNSSHASYSNNRNYNVTRSSNRSHYGSNYDRGRYYPIQVRGTNYFYRNGHYYNYRSNRYISVSAPIGARVNFLPSSAISISYGSNRYFRVGLTWYLGRNNYYEVIDRPPVVVERQVVVQQQSQEPVYQEDYQPSYAEQQPDLVIYPASGQSENQQDKDNYECYRWSREESNYDPTKPYQDLGNKDIYIRAMTACMEARGYAVR